MTCTRTISLLSLLLLNACSNVVDSEQLARKAQDGDRDACYEYGHRLLVGKDIRRNQQEALKWLKTAALEGDIRAAAALGACYAHGLGTAPDVEQARRWYTIAAEAGHRHAQLDLANHYMKVMPQEPRKAVTYIRYAAMDGSADAAFLMSIFFAEGYGVPHHDGIALGWLINAAELGHEQAREIIRDIHQRTQNQEKS